MSDAEKQKGSPSPAASTYSNEKAHTSQVERVSPEADGAQGHEIYNPHIDVSGIDEKKLIRKLDWYLVPWLSLLYLLSFLDRTSIGNAKVRRPRSRKPYVRAEAVCADARRTCDVQLYHMEKDLNISDNEYLIALTIFFFSYAIFEVRELVRQCHWARCACERCLTSRVRRCRPMSS